MSEIIVSVLKDIAVSLKDLVQEQHQSNLLQQQLLHEMREQNEINKRFMRQEFNIRTEPRIAVRSSSEEFIDDANRGRVVQDPELPRRETTPGGRVKAGSILSSDTIL